MEIQGAGIGISMGPYLGAMGLGGLTLYYGYTSGSVLANATLASVVGATAAAATSVAVLTTIAVTAGFCLGMSLGAVFDGIVYLKSR